MPLVTTSYHGDHEDEPRNWGEIKKGYSHFANGDVGLAKITPCFENSKAAVFRNLRNGIGAGTTELHVARPLSSAINPYFLLLFLKSPRFLKEGEKVMTGSAGQKRVPKGYFSETPLPLPPEEEQHRIVQKVDELMALCDRLEQQTSDQLEAHETLVDTLLGTLTQSESATELADNWARLAAHFDTLFTTEQSIDKLKQTILQLAVMGRLVEQDVGDDSAKGLLASIERRKQELVEAKQIKTPKKLPAITSEETLFEIPQNWQWVKFGELGLFINGDRSKNYPNKEEYVERGVAWINTGHIEPSGTLTRTHMHFITREKYDSLRSGKIEPTDLVYCLRGATFGKTAFVTPYEEGAIASSLMIIRPYLPAMRSYIYRYLTSPFGRSQIFRFDNGSAQPNLSANSVMMYAFPLPPLEEQHRIVQKVDELMALCDQLKGRLNQANETRCQLAETIVEQGLSA
ncbi:restriction endonuclease [Marinobacter guineae]|uniref:Restriction endonuclease n=2 Tax=Marinobacter guineae TaxID=432303 RepID=A0A2G1VLF7_9GAMM|nr:restriction endonuclease [Marinobacter guineae]